MCYGEGPQVSFRLHLFYGLRRKNSHPLNLSFPSLIRRSNYEASGKYESSLDELVILNGVNVLFAVFLKVQKILYVTTNIFSGKTFPFLPLDFTT